MQNKQILGHDIIVARTRAEYNCRRQKLSNFPLTSKYLVPESLALRYSCFTLPHERKRAALVTPLFSPLCPQHSSPEPLPFPSPTPEPRQATESSPPPQRWTSHPDGSTFRTLEPPTANSPLHRSCFSDWLVHHSSLLDLHHGPPHWICLTGALVHHSVGPSLTPASVPSLALQTSPRPPQ